MSDSLNELIRDYLNHLESQEVKLLSWGWVDGGFSEDEVNSMAEALLQQHEVELEPWELVNHLQDRGLLFEFNLRGQQRYRTRMAETVRLLARLRQLFPRRDWRTSPTLVADYRFSLRRRLYPERSLAPEAVVEALEAEKLLNPIRRRSLEALLQSPDRSLHLAEFQRRATDRMLRDLNSTRSRGMIVCAGTGTGKTLAFYLPALTHIASTVKKKAFWTKALAIYPRNELLKDQFSETYAEARRLDTVLKAERKILIGAFFGLTPRRAELAELQDRWIKNPKGYICPYLRCPKCGSAQLCWQRNEWERGKEQLTCLTRNCDTIIHEDEIILTRDRMAQTPPDLVFTTTEMLNRSLGDSRLGHVFGVRVTRPPQIVLLDEVHTYTGIHGAQVAYLLRRWQHVIGKRVQFTGLSATLRGAADFFAQLTGLSPGAIEEISPSPDSLKPEGMEYLLALRGDPVSGTSLLSTSIQTGMLLRRVLDPAHPLLSQGTYGSRVFAFTDDLDVTNRLFHNLLDAEGRNSASISIKPPLADLRSSDKLDHSDRLLLGQSWYMCEQIRHTLRNPLQVTRTSSQDTGVDQDADVIVATAALEVGFNDPDVGAVIQHKAPRDMASFLQRKGRAGRRRAMRPWTVVVLSDYGRDRLAYQSYDLLFDPMLEERRLPIANRYVMRIQAAFAFMDWAAQQLAEIPRGSIWQDFSNSAWHTAQRQRQLQAITLIKCILEQDEPRQALEEYLQNALKLSQEDVQAVLWEPPRALMMSVLPTLLRRLESEWKRLALPGEPDLDYHTKNPLPDFVPGSLFSDLLLPEVAIATPPQSKTQTESDINFMPILQALKTFAPGRVSRRFGVRQSRASHWIAPPELISGEQTLSIEDYCIGEEEGTFQMWQNGQIVSLRCIRPWRLEPTQIPTFVGDRSNASLTWRTQIVPPDTGNQLDLPQGSAWLQVIEQVCSFTHNQQNPLEVRRFAIGSEANLRVKRNDQTEEIETSVQFVERDGQLASVGFAQSADGLVFRFRFPVGFTICPDDSNQAKVRAFRASYFRHRILHDDRLDGLANFFQRDWLYQIFLSALTARALQNGIDLALALDRLDQLSQAMASVLEGIFQTLRVEEANLEAGDSSEPQELPEAAVDSPSGYQPTHVKLLELCQTPIVLEVLSDLAQTLWSSPDTGWQEWAQHRFKGTLGGVLLEACHQLCPQFDSGDLILDLEAGAPAPEAPLEPEGLGEIWITEATVGGGGVIEEILRRYAIDPAHFFRLAESALEPSDFEIVDTELTRLLELTETSETIETALNQVRLAESYYELSWANEELRRSLTAVGFLVTHPVMAAINARILTPGSKPQTDQQLLDLIRTWRQEEERLGIEIDARAFAYVASTQERFWRSLPPDVRMQPILRFQAILSRLWSRGNLIRARVISFYNPFAEMPEGDREIVLDVLQPAETVVRVEEPDWRSRVEQALETDGVVSLIAHSESLSVLKHALVSLMVNPTEMGFLSIYPVLEGIKRESNSYTARLRVREIVR